jgi:nucleoside-diphosphate-sugar epimerase
MTDMAAACVAGTAIALHEEEVWIDPVHVQDAAAAFRQAASLLGGVVRSGELARYSVTCGRDVSSSDLAAVFQKLVNRPLIVERRPSSSVSRRVKPWRGTTVPGWQPCVPLEAGVARMLQQISNNPKRESAAL